MRLSQRKPLFHIKMPPNPLFSSLQDHTQNIRPLNRIGPQAIQHPSSALSLQMADITDPNTHSPGLDDANTTDPRGVKRPRVSTAADDDDDDDDKPGRERRKIDIKFIQDKSRRHITFSKRKAGIMKKVTRSPMRNTQFALSLGFKLIVGRHDRPMNCLYLPGLKCYSWSSRRQDSSTPSLPQSFNPSSPSQKARISYRYDIHLLSMIAY